ncbi:dihydrolipoamide acetyltransferase family protein [Streptomyces sp. NPDC005402]|uniref:dihydrolipoamide acetyltransferase family protein n=1 Tax=Streptomyces sp. NPDC005402 TaxID=3155338 RepID=UPI0033A253C7
MPDVGEGLSEADILQWYVKPGDRVHDGMTVCEVETAKAAVELPIPYDGAVHEIRCPAGTTVDIGAVIITVDTAPDGGPEPADPPTSQPADPPAPEPEPQQALLVGYGVMNGSTRRRPRKPRAERERPARREAVPGAAKPPVRKLARDLGVDLGLLVPSGPGGVITREDVHAAARTTQPPVAVQPARVPASDERRVPIKGVRKATAEAMVRSAFTAPHVTEFSTVDVTRTVKLVQQLKQDPDFAGLRVTPLLLVARAFLAAVRRFPEINASWDEAAQEVVIKERVHLGIAAATPRGLLVPNIKDAHTRNLPQLAAELGDLVATARAGRTTPADLSGGTVTITNLGVFGVDTGTPILNPGEAAILAVGAIRTLPWVHRSKVKPRQVLTLALSFDHRLVDGELGSKVLAATAEILEQPKRLVTWA